MLACFYVSGNNAAFVAKSQTYFVKIYSSQIEIIFPANLFCAFVLGLLSVIDIYNAIYALYIPISSAGAYASSTYDARIKNLT